MRQWLRIGCKGEEKIGWMDEMRIGLISQLRRQWSPSGIKLVQKQQRKYQWAYLVLWVDVKSGKLVWCWQNNMGSDSLLETLKGWKEEGVSVAVCDNAPSHVSKKTREGSEVSLIYQPPYSPELNPVERIFEWIRSEIEDKLYPSIEAKKGAVEVALKELSSNVEQVRQLVGWDWIMESFEALKINLAWINSPIRIPS